MTDRGGPSEPGGSSASTGGSGVPPMARADLLTGAVLLVLGLAMLYGGFTMDRHELRRIHPASIPGLVPMMLGAALAVCSIILMAGARRASGAAASAEPSSLRRLLIALAIALAYPLVLIGRLDFWLATALFVTAFIVVFEWRERSAIRHAIALATAALQGVIVGAVTAYVFQEFFLVRLP